MKKLFKTFLLCLIGLFVVMLLVIQIPKINTRITEFALNIALPQGIEARISPLHGEFPFNFMIDSVKVYDRNGQWLNVEKLRFSWVAANILFGKIDISKLGADTVEVLRFPVAFSQNIPKKKEGLFSLQIENYFVNHLRIAPWFSGAVKLHGDALLYSNDADFSLFLETTDQLEHGDADLLELTIHKSGDHLKIFAEAADSLTRLRTIAPELTSKIKEGDYEFHIDLDANLDGTGVTGSCTGAINNFLSMDVKFDRFIGDQLDFDINVQLDDVQKNIIGKGNFSTSNNIKAKWNLIYDINKKVYVSDLNTALPQIEHLLSDDDKQFTGDIKAVLQAKGQVGHHHQVAWTITGPTAFGHNLEKSTGNVFFENQKGRFSSQFIHPHLRTSLNGKFEVDDKLISFNSVHFQGQNHNVTANATIDLDNYQVDDLDVQLTIESIQPFLKFVGKEGSGHLKTTITKKKGRYDITLKADQLIYQDVGFQTITSKMSLLNPENFKMDLDVGAGHYKQTNIDSIILKADSVNGKGHFSHQVNTPDLQLITNGRLVLDPQNWKVLVNNLKFIHQEQSILNIIKPLTIDISSDTLKIGANKLKLNVGEIKFTDLVFGKTYAGKLSLVDVTPQIFSLMLHDQEVMGQIKGDLEFSTHQDSPYIKGKLDFQDISIHNNYRKTHKTISFTTDVKFQNQQWVLKANYHDTESSKLEVQGTITTPTLIPQKTAPITMRARGHVDLSICNGFIWWGDRLKGQLKIDVSTSNTLSQMQHQGTFSLNEGEYENAEFGTVLRHIDLNASLKGSMLTITKLSGNDFKEGRFSGAGTVKLADLAAIQPQISLMLTKMLVANNDIIALNVSGKIDIKPLKKDSFVIGGKVQANFGDVFLEDSVQKIKNINMIEVTKQSLLRRKPLKNRTKNPTQSLYDLKVHIPDNLFMEGHNIKSRWGGDLHVQGALNMPEIKGAIEIVRGRADILGKQMAFKKGSKISFVTYKNEVEPVLDIKLEKTIREVILMIWAHGMASDPKIDFISNPALSQEEVVSFLLFGKPLSSVSAAQSLQLATRLAAIKTGKDGVNLMDQFQKAFGLDEFSVGGSESTDDLQSSQEPGVSNGYAVRVGKQLNDQVYFGIEQELGTDSDTKALVNIDITKDTKINLEAGSRGGSVGYMWEKRY